MHLMVFLFAALVTLAVAIYLFGWAVSVAIGLALRGRLDAKKWQSRGKFAVIVGIPIWLIYAIYLSFHPRDDFYLQRLSLVALRDTPKSARVVAKSPSLFGLHSGESCAYSRMEISHQDYSNFYESIASDPRFFTGYKWYQEMRDGKLVDIEEDKVSMSENRWEVERIAGEIPTKMSYLRSDPEQPFNRQYALIFLSDEKHIDVYSCI